MSYRYMRVIVMFDLPVLTAQERRDYTRFRKHLLKNGFLMMQESIYCKLAQSIRKNKPEKGLIQVMKVTEKQYSKIECIIGEKQNEVLDSDERLIIL